MVEQVLTQTLAEVPEAARSLKRETRRRLLEGVWPDRAVWLFATPETRAFTRRVLDRLDNSSTTVNDTTECSAATDMQSAT